MTTMVTLIFLLFGLLSQSNGEWIQGSSIMPTGTFRACIGSYESTIYILGGSNSGHSKRITYFDVDTEQFSRASQDFTDYVRAPSIQIGSDIFTIDRATYIQDPPLSNTGYWVNGGFINVYSMAYNTYSTQYSTIPYTDRGQSCMTASEEYLFVLGGSDNRAQAMHLNTKQWTLLTPMKEQRSLFSCIYHSSTQKLFAIASDTSHTIEYAVINDINSIVWTLMTQQFTQIISAHDSAVLVDDMIWLIGGVVLTDNTYAIVDILDVVHIIDPVLETITISSEKLPYHTHAAGVIEHNRRVYVFGGCCLYRNTYLMYQLPTSSPTNVPSLSPTPSPTPSPTYNPTTITNNPTPFPTTEPTPSPTSAPTYNPTTITNNPTPFPTTEPTPAPTTEPTPTPTGFANYFTYNNVFEASRATISCPDDANCIISCNEELSCIQATILCPRNYKCFIKCSAGHACLDAHIDCTESGGCDIECTGYNSCKESFITCPINGNCDIYAHGTYTLLYAVINANHTDGGDLVMVFDVDSSFGFDLGTVWCPKNAVCNITGYGSWTFEYANIYAQQQTDLLYVYGTGGYGVFSGTNIHCPWSLNPGYENNCIIEHDHNEPAGNGNLEIWAVESLNDVKIICDAIDVNNCAAATIHCTEDYSESCTLVVSDTPRNYQCQDTDNKCYNYQLTLNPTKPPTPECSSMKVTVIDSNGLFNSADFDGLYTFTVLKQKFNRPTWEQNDKNIEYSGSGWVINGIGDELLSHSSNEDFPPDNDVNAQWSHSSVLGTFHVLIECSHSYSPTTVPTPAPTSNPTPTPTNNPTPPPTNNPTKSPTRNPSLYPTTT
eukprot:314771_1